MHFTRALSMPLILHAQAGEPAQKRETLLDKILYPWSKDASDDTHAREMAASYNKYVEVRLAD